MVIEQEDSLAKLLLVGIDVGEVKRGTEFVTSEGQGGVEVVAREGLIATGKISGAVEVGAVLRVREN